MNLRDYQISACDAVMARLRASERPILVLPTGAGKSVCAQAIANRFITERPGSRVLFLAHRRELVLQLSSHLEKSGLRVGIIKSGFPRVLELPVQVASVQTLASRELPHADLLVWDECHHLLAKTFRRISDAYGDACQMGLTATPWRLDGKGLGGVFTNIVVGARSADLCNQGYLIEPRVFAPMNSRMILKGIHHVGGDYVRSELAKRVDQPKLVADVVSTWKQHALGVKTVCFAVNIAHSQHIVEKFIAAGVRAEHCDGETPEHVREAILARLASGETEIVSNVDLFGEGFDLPAIGCCIQARPTESMSIWMQQGGRVMRPSEGKTQAIILDHAGLFHKFGRLTQHLEYSLEGEPTSTSPKTEGHGLKTCTNCFRMVLRSRAKCPECGFDLTTEAEIPEFEAGELVDVNDVAAVTPARPVHNENEDAWKYIEETRIETGRQPGWAVAEYRRQFGHTPSLVNIGGVRVMVTPNASEPVREAAWESFKEDARKLGKTSRRDICAYAAVRCNSLFGSVPAAAKKRAKENRKAKVAA